MTKLTIHDCALNAAESLGRASAEGVATDERGFHLGTADIWIRLLDTMNRAGMGVAERSPHGEPEA